MARKKWEDLDVIDNALMNALATDPDVAEPFFRRMLSVLLERNIGKITVIAERMLPGTTTERRGVRLDVEIDEAEADSEYLTSVYDVEPHLQNDLDFPRMLRFRQAKIDSRHMQSGDSDYSHLPDLYILYITNFDYFGKDRMVYTFRHKCKEEPELEYNDGLHILYFNTRGKTGGSRAIENMLKYLEHSRTDSAVDTATIELDGYVNDVKHSEERRGGYMTVGDWGDMERAAGRAEGRIEGREEHLIDQICRKLRKGKTVQEIADALDEDEIRVGMICRVAEHFAPDYDAEQVFEELQGSYSKV